MKEWPKIKLEFLLTESKIPSANPDSSKRIRVKLNLGGVDQRPDSQERQGATRYYLRRAGQFIYGKQNLHKGAFGIIPEDLDGYESSGDLPAFDVKESCHPDWILYFFKQGNLYEKLSNLAKGIGSKRIQPKQLFNLSIPLPPKEKQQDILNSIYELEKNASIILKEFERQVDLVRKLQASILNDAFTGRLTIVWRSANSNTESAEKLLQKIYAERKVSKRISKLKMPKISATLLKSIKEKGLPNSWVVCRFGDYAFCERGRFSARPRNDPKYFNGNTPFIQIGDIPENGGYINQHKQTLNEQGLKVSKLFRQDTVVIAIVGATIGITGILEYNMAFPDSIVGVQPTTNTNFRFIELFLRSKKGFFRDKSYSGGGQPNIKLPIINDAIMNLPPLEEQSAIVEKVDILNGKCDLMISHIEQEISDLSSSVSSLLNSIWGNDNIIPTSEPMATKKETRNVIQELLNTVKKYEKSEIAMGLEQLLKENGKMSAISLWQMSEFSADIDAFYEDLKKKVEIEKTIKESKEKGFLELAK